MVSVLSGGEVIVCRESAGTGLGEANYRTEQGVGICTARNIVKNKTFRGSQNTILNAVCLFQVQRANNERAQDNDLTGGGEV